MKYYVICIISSLLALSKVEAQDPFQLAAEIQNGDEVGFNSDFADLTNSALADITFVATRKNLLPVRRNEAEAAIVTEIKFVSTLMTNLEDNRRILKKVSGDIKARIAKICKFATNLVESTIGILNYIHKKVKGIHMNMVAMAAETMTQVQHYVSDTLFCFLEEKNQTRTDYGNNTEVAMMHEYTDLVSRSTNHNIKLKLKVLSHSESVINEHVHFLMDRATYIKDSMDHLINSLEIHM